MSDSNNENPWIDNTPPGPAPYQNPNPAVVNDSQPGNDLPPAGTGLPGDTNTVDNHQPLNDGGGGGS